MAGLRVEVCCNDGAWVEYGPKEIHELHPGVVLIHHEEDGRTYQLMCKVRSGTSFIYFYPVENATDPNFDESACKPVCLCQDGDRREVQIRSSEGYKRTYRFTHLRSIAPWLVPSAHRSHGPMARH